MLWAFWMDKNTSHCVTPPQKKMLQRIPGMGSDGLGTKEWKTEVRGQPVMKQNQISLNCKSKTEKLCREQGENLSKRSHKERAGSHLGSTEGKLVMKKALGSKSWVELSVQSTLGLVSKTMYLGFVP